MTKACKHYGKKVECGLLTIKCVNEYGKVLTYYATHGLKNAYLDQSFSCKCYLVWESYDDNRKEVELSERRELPFRGDYTEWRKTYDDFIDEVNKNERRENRKC